MSERAGSGRDILRGSGAHEAVGTQPGAEVVGTQPGACRTLPPIGTSVRGAAGRTQAGRLVGLSRALVCRSPQLRARGVALRSGLGVCVHRCSSMERLTISGVYWCCSGLGEVEGVQGVSDRGTLARLHRTKYTGVARCVVAPWLRWAGAAELSQSSPRPPTPHHHQPDPSMTERPPAWADVLTRTLLGANVCGVVS